MAFLSLERTQGSAQQKNTKPTNKENKDILDEIWTSH